MPNLRIVIQVYDDTTMQQNHGSARVVLTEAHQRMIAQTSDIKSPAAWAAEELRSILSCLEDIERATA